MRVVVPFDAVRPKTRLSPVLDEAERASFARAALGDVLAALRGAGLERPEVLATGPVAPGDLAVGPVDADSVPEFDLTVDERPLTAAVNAVLEASLSDDPRATGDSRTTGDPGSDCDPELIDDPRPADDPPPAGAPGGTAGPEPVAVVMADLALVTPAAVERLVAADGEVVLVPGRGGGTNALVARHPGFRVDYHGVSYRDHRRIAREAGAAVTTVDSYRLSTDVDERTDLPEVLLHGGERSRRWLRDRGFRVAVTDGRVTVER